MKKMCFLCLAVTIGVFTAGPAFAQTKKELQSLIKEVITDNEYQMMLKIREATGRNWMDIFDNSIEPLREDSLQGNESARKYIMPSQKSVQDAAKESAEGGVTEDAAKPAKKLAIEINSAAVGQDDDVQPIQVPPPSEEQKSRRLYPRQYKYKERMKERTAAKASAVEEIPAEKEETAESPDKESLRERLKAAPSIEKRRPLIDRKPPTYRSYERRKKIEDYNRTNKRNAFTGERLDGKVEDKGFSTRGFKKKEFGSKIIYDEEVPEEEADQGTE